MGLTPYTPSLLERWKAGCHTALRLWRALRQRGSAGGYGVGAAYARRWRQAQGLPPGHRRPRPALPAVAEPLCQPLTPRRATGLGRRRAEKRTEAEAHQRTQVREQQGEVAKAIDLALDCAHLVRQRQPARLDPWVQRATTRALEAIRRFAPGLSEDSAAVQAGVTLPWRSSPVEGPIKRLKMLKRQMCGRARLDRLRRRFLLAPRARRARVSYPPAQSDAHAQAAAA